MPSHWTKQIRRSKENVEYHRRRTGDAQTRIGQVVASHVEAAGADEVQRVAVQGGAATSDAARSKATAQSSARAQPGASAQPSASAQTTAGASRSAHTLARIDHTAIEKVMAGDGSTVNGREFPVDEFFAASSWQNDISSFYHIKMSSYRSPAWKNAVFSVHSETEAAKKYKRLPPAPSPRIHKGNYNRATMIICNSVRAWCLAHPGYSVSKRGPGVRGRSSAASSYFVYNGSVVLEHGPKGNCLPSAVVNAFERLVGGSLATKVRDDLRKHKGPLNSIGHAQRAIHKAAPGFNFKKVQDPEFRADKMKWMAAVKQGVWIVRFQAGNTVDHCVFVDGTKREIVDNEEKKPMRLCEGSLRACGGDDATDLCIAEVRKLYKSSKSVHN